MLAISARRQNSSSRGPDSGWSSAPSKDRMSTKPRSIRSTDTARAKAPSWSSPRTFRNRPLDWRNSSSSSSGIPPAALRCRRRSSGTRLNQVGWLITLTPRARKISSRSENVIAASRSGDSSGGHTPA